MNCTFEGSLNSTTLNGWKSVRSAGHSDQARTRLKPPRACWLYPAYAWELSATLLGIASRHAWPGSAWGWETILETGHRANPRRAGFGNATYIRHRHGHCNAGRCYLSRLPPCSQTAQQLRMPHALVKNTAGTLWSIAVSVTNAAARFLKLFNLTTVSTVGTSPVFCSHPIGWHGAG